MKWLWGVAAVVAGLFFAIWYRRNPHRQIKRELKAIDKAKVVEESMRLRGAVRTRELIEEEHKQAIDDFDSNLRKKYENLRDDPVALAKWLTRVSD